jgi:hypothetical protein
MQIVNVTSLGGATIHLAFRVFNNGPKPFAALTVDKLVRNCFQIMILRPHRDAIHLRH